MVRPANALSDVRRLAADERSCEFFRVVLLALREHGLDSDDLRDIICHELGEAHCFKTKPTERYYPQTFSDYYAIWIDDCRCSMFLKLLIVTLATGKQRLVVTSFKKDSRHEQ